MSNADQPTLGALLLQWMATEDRSPGHLATKSSITSERLVDLITGAATATSSDISDLAVATGLTEEQLQEACTSADPDDRQADPLDCFTPKEVAKLLRVSTDSVYRELNEGVLQHVVFGERVKRIPRQTLEQRLAQVGGAV